MNRKNDGVFGALLQEYNVARVRQVNQERSARIAALKNRADAEKYIAEIREKIARSFALPPRPAKIKAEVTGIIDTPDYRIEKIIYESLPDFPVTANLYLPQKRTAPVPAVLFLCGHAQEGKICDTYKTGAVTLAKNGFAVLLIDPVSQGERYQFIGAENSVSIAGSCTREHNMLAKQLWLCDEFFGSWRANDALCGLDYLLSRPEIDTARVGVTGNSGGGTMTTFVQALDPRFTMAAPSCYVTSWQRNIENELPADAEQIPPGILAAGCEMGDFVLAYAPRPILLMGQKKDFFDPRGLKETYEECRKVYALLGAEDNLQLFIGPTHHGYSVENRQAMYRFFDCHAAMNGKDILDETDNGAVPGRQLLCSPGGQTANMPGKKLVHDLIVDKLDEFAVNRKKLNLSELKNLFTGKYGFPASVEVPYFRVLRNSEIHGGTPATASESRFALETEPGLLTVMRLRSENSLDYFFYFPEIESLTLYVPHLSGSDELANCHIDTPVAAVEVRNIGENHSLNCDVYSRDDFFHAYGSDYHYNSCDIMFGGSMLGGRVRDLLGAVALAEANGVKDIRLAGKGQGALTALFAAILLDGKYKVRLFDAPESFDSMARARITLWPHSIMPRGILKYTDLPDMYEALKDAGKLEIVNFCDNLFLSRF